MQKRTYHGLTQHPLYRCWHRMKQRCGNRNRPRYKDWGGRGITVCAEWIENPKDFITWALVHGWQKGLEIDRIDNDKGYSPDNCRFVNSQRNALNKRIIQSNNNSGYRGVCKKRAKWQAMIVVKGKRTILGCFTTPVDAVKIRNKYIVENNLQNDYIVQEIL